MQLGTEITKYGKDIEYKMDKADAARIWRYLKRFAEYEDLKDLRNRIIPEIAKFEQKISDF